MPQTSSTQSTNPLDKFYTRPQTACLCLAHLREVLPDLKADLWVEPAAGDGVFFDRLPAPRIGIDIAPDVPGMETCDFLGWTPAIPDARIVVVGNPPFGKNGAVATRFFNAAARYAEVIAMILPASMMKSSMQARLDKRFHLVGEMALPGEPFRVGNALHRVNVVFQIWQRAEMPRKRISTVVEHADFSFVASPAEADFAVRRVGGRAGAILPLPANTARGYAPSSNYFIKARGLDPQAVERRFRAIDFSEVRDHVASNPSVSKREIVALYEACARLEALRRAAAPAETPELASAKELAGDRGAVGY